MMWNHRKFSLQNIKTDKEKKGTKEGWGTLNQHDSVKNLSPKKSEHTRVSKTQEPHIKVSIYCAEERFSVSAKEFQLCRELNMLKILRNELRERNEITHTS